jgi:hypothetical protein
MPKWRPFTWIILAVNVLFLVWLITGVGGAADQAEDCTALVGNAKDLCEAGNAGTAVGAGIGAAIILFLWALVDVILGILWLVTRPKRRPCPVCGTEVKQGVVVCPKCSHDFRSASQGVKVSTSPPPPTPGL